MHTDIFMGIVSRKSDGSDELWCDEMALFYYDYMSQQRKDRYFQESGLLCGLPILLQKKRQGLYDFICYWDCHAWRRIIGKGEIIDGGDCASLTGQWALSNGACKKRY